MVSFGVAVPVVKLVADAVAVQVALSRARSSVTVTCPPRSEEMVLPGAPEPRFAEAGAVIESAPLVTVKVTVVFGSPAAGPPAAVLVVAAHAAVPVRPVAMMAAALILRPSTL